MGGYHVAFFDVLLFNASSDMLTEQNLFRNSSEPCYLFDRFVHLLLADCDLWVKFRSYRLDSRMKRYHDIRLASVRGNANVLSYIHFPNT